ncbi:MAG: hypothetical protein VKP62_08685 [Candidatus Sericytochromatia bacterium]|nr:hypothetical protein [Candidatus Sericytochromatia bacterium]
MTPKASSACSDVRPRLERTCCPRWRIQRAALLRAGVWLAGGAAIAASAGCTLPYVTAEQSLVIPYASFLPSWPQQRGEASPDLKETRIPVTSLLLPAETQRLQVTGAMIRLRILNQGPLPLVVTPYMSLSGGDPYQLPPLGAPLSLGERGFQVTQAYPWLTDQARTEAASFGLKVSLNPIRSAVTGASSDHLELRYQFTATARIP